MESGWLDGQRHLLFTIPGPVVCDGEVEACCCAHHVLVAQPGRRASAAELRPLLLAQFCLYFRLFVHPNTVHSESNHPPPARGGAFGLPKLRETLSAALAFLFLVRDAAGRNGREGSQLRASATSQGVISSGPIIPISSARLLGPW